MVSANNTDREVSIMVSHESKDTYDKPNLLALKQLIEREEYGPAVELARFYSPSYISREFQSDLFSRELQSDLEYQLIAKYRNFWIYWINVLLDDEDVEEAEIMSVVQEFSSKLFLELTAFDDTEWWLRGVTILEGRLAQACLVRVCSRGFEQAAEFPGRAVPMSTVERLKKTANHIKEINVIPTAEENNAHRAVAGEYWPDVMPKHWEDVDLTRFLHPEDSEQG